MRVASRNTIPVKVRRDRWSPFPRLGIVENGPRIQMGFLPALAPALPWILGILGTGGAVIGLSALARHEAEKWKESTGLNLSNVPIAVLSGGAGAIAFVISGNLEGTGKAIATSLGVVGIAGAVYALFTGNPAPPPASAVSKAPPTVPPARSEHPVPVLAPGPLVRSFTLSLIPSQPNTGGTTRQMWADQDWEFVIRNETASPYSVYSGISIYDEGSQLLWKSSLIDPVYGRKLTDLAPGSAAPVILKSHSLDFRSLPSSVAVQVDLFRNRDDSTPFMSSEAIPIKMSYIG